ncbi:MULTISPECIES: triacylglycerol lipase [Acinetobacter calcoaceticus/baumannii complex]|uniref:esterase/lipase family protein n=1 Tax=Acinetobacter calcoaceticus/baumannii complex TaxID=909768 RepID=UPI0022227801|nr:MULTISPECIES: alpha/beta fold hydrolase [Acinetobacter calcoaceticus/baumannii complex]MCW1473709.1 alpha/beta fold hydrolase [Acinetobacter baumannii]MDX8255669.1 alpha/beta fold hydrolase [Acinetobacter pittii]
MRQDNILRFKYSVLRWIKSFIVISSLFSLSSIFQVFAETTKQPVIFVHGLGGSATNFILMKNYLKSQGWVDAELFAVELPSKTGNQLLNSATISRAVDQAITKTGHNKVNIVAHSMGGANSLYYILYNGGSTKVDKLVTLGGANLLTTSQAPSGIKVTSIYSSADTIVSPALSKLNGATNIQVNFVGHIGLLYNANVNDLIKSALSE